MIRSLCTSSFAFALLCLSTLATTTTAQFLCPAHSSNQNVCDAAKSEDGSGCVYCHYGSFSFCVSGGEAAAMKLIVKDLSCDNDPNSGDDDDDDDAVAPTSDDSIPDDSVFGCLKKENDSDCGKSGSCVWCDTKGGFGVCVTEEAAENAKDSFWFDCAGNATTSSSSNNNDIQDPLDTACLLAGLAGGNDESVCVAAADSDGNKCEFCTISAGIDLCLNADQAQLASLVGGSCDSSDMTTKDSSAGAGGVGASLMMDLKDPYDTACLMAQAMSGGSDKSACFSAEDSDGYGCEWCSLSNGLNFCLTSEQASIAEVVGSTCENGSSASNNIQPGVGASSMMKKKERNVQDPADTACLLAGLAGGNDESVCLAAKDSDGNACESCSISTFVFCLNPDQAQIASLVGANCDSINLSAGVDAAAMNEEEEDDVQDPTDPSCLLAGLAGGNDESVCVAAVDSDGNKCEFCSIANGVDLCLNSDQAEIASLVGGSCGSNDASAGFGGAGASLMDLQDPYDTTCLMSQVSAGNDESACVSASDSGGYGCEWCSLSNGLSFCLSSEQASIAEVVGGTCEDSKNNIQAGVGVAPMKEEGNVQDPTDTACLLAGLAGGNDKSVCVAAVDSDGNACEFCSISNGFDFCLNSEQAQLASLVGGTCDSKNKTLGSDNTAVAYKKTLRN